MYRLKKERGELGDRLRIARERAAVSQEEAALAAEVQSVAVDSWERGRSVPCPIQLRRLIAAYGVPAHWMLFGEHQIEFSRAEAAEILRSMSAASAGLRARLEIVLAISTEAAGEVTGGR